MKHMLEYDLVRRMYFHEDLSRREIARRTGYHRRTIDKMLRYSGPRGYQRREPALKPKIGPFVAIIDAMLASDGRMPRKQRHTAKRIFERLVDEHGFAGGYTIVKDYVRDKRLRLKEVFVPLEQRPGTSQIDFGSARVVLDGQEQDAQLFCMALPHSDAFFVKAYPTTALEAVQDGHISAYAFLDGIPRHSLYDNMSPVVKRVLGNGERALTAGFLALRSHYLFQSRFCNVGRANEKGVVENLVGYVRRNFMVPLPQFRDWDALNSYLESACRKRLGQKAAGKDKTIGELLAEEKSTFLPLPATALEACRLESRRVTSLSLVRLETNSYSVPVRYAYRDVVVKLFVDRVVIAWQDQSIACHRRSYGQHDYVFDPVHYLPLLERKPGALEGGMPFSGWELPGSFDLLQRVLQSRHGAGGKREYIQVLQLLRDFTIAQVNQAIEKAFRYRCLNFEAIKMLVVSGDDDATEIVRLSGEHLERLPRIRIDNGGTRQYRMLLAGGAS